MAEGCSLHVVGATCLRLSHPHCYRGTQANYGVGAFVQRRGRTSIVEWESNHTQGSSDIVYSWCRGCGHTWGWIV